MKMTIKILGVALVMASSAQAAVYYRIPGNMPGSDRWNDAYWSLDGNAPGVVPTSGNTYVATAELTKMSNTFIGDSITYSGTASAHIKGTATGNLILDDWGGTITAGNNGVNTLNGTIAGTGAFIFDTYQGGRSITLNSLLTSGNTLTTISLTGNDQTGVLRVTNASNTFTGTWDITMGLLMGTTTGSLGASSFDVAATGVLDFDYDFSNESGSLTLAGVLDLDQDLTFGAVSIGGVVLDQGTYDIDDLIAIDGIDASYFSDGSGSLGTIQVVPEPSSTTLLGLFGLASLMIRRR